MDDGKKIYESDPSNNEASVVNIYLVYSPLHYLAAESIATHLEQNARNFLFYLKEEFRGLVDNSRWDSAGFLPWPRFYPDKGLLGRMRRTRKNLDIVGKVCAGASVIRLHSPVIDTEAVNYLINFLKDSNPGSSFAVRLIPDGLLNVQRYPLSRLKKLLQYCKKTRRLIDPALNYYTFSGDRTGSDAAIVDRIYVLPGFPHEYDQTKTYEISLLNDCGHNDAATDGEIAVKRALVLGQPLTQKRLSQQDMRSITLGVRAFIASCGISDISYKTHPRDANKELSHPDYKELVIDQPLETYLSQHSFDLVIGVFSAALLTARLILPKSCRVVAYGTNAIRFRGAREKNSILSSFALLDVELVDLRN